MAEPDVVEYNEIQFRRYPDAEQWAERSYYRPSGDHIENGVEALHREVYKDHFGEIPDGHVVHHIDGDSTNNDPSNLEAVTPEEHIELHDWTDSDPPTPQAVEAAAEWHRSEEGREWHRQHWEESLADQFDPVERECDYCGSSFEDRSPDGKGRFCSNNCKTQYRRESGVDDVVKECPVCGEEFATNRYQQSKTCGRSCGAKLRWEDR